MALLNDPWIVSTLTTSQKPIKPTARIVHIYSNAEEGANSTLKTSEPTVSEPLLVLLSDGKHMVKAILTDNAIRNVETQLDIERSSFLGSFMIILEFDVYANCNLENEEDREMMLVVDSFRYLGGETTSITIQGLVGSWTEEDVRRQLININEEKQASMLSDHGLGEDTQLMFCLDNTVKSQDGFETDGMLASVLAMRRIIDRIIESHHGDGDHVMKNTSEGGCHGDIDHMMKSTSSNGDCRGDDHVMKNTSKDGCHGDGDCNSLNVLQTARISINQQHKIDDLIRQLIGPSGKDNSKNKTHVPNSASENNNKAVDPEAENLTEDKHNETEAIEEQENSEEELSLFVKSDESLLEHFLPSQLTDKFSENQEPMEIVIPSETDDRVLSLSPEVQPITIDIETIIESCGSSEDVDEVRNEKCLDSEETTVATNEVADEQSSDATTFSGASTGVSTDQVGQTSKGIHMNKSILGFNVSALPSGVVPTLNCIPCNQEQAASKSDNNSGDKPEQWEICRYNGDQAMTDDHDVVSTQDDASMNVDQVTTDDSRDVISTQDDASVSVSSTRISRRVRNGRRKRRSFHNSESVYPKRFLALKLNKVQCGRNTLPEITHRAPLEEDINTDLYQFCINYWKTKTDAPMFGDLL